MNNQSVTILETWDWEKIEIPFEFEVWLNTKTSAKNNWEDWIYLKSHNRYLKFSNIKDEKGKVKYISLPEPVKEFKELTKEERENRDKMLSEIMEKTYEKRKENFIKRRKEILKELERNEKKFWLETTIEKINILNDFRKKDDIQKLQLQTKEWN